MGNVAKTSGIPQPLMNNVVRELRVEQKWSQAELGDKLDVSRQTINAIETGRYDPSLPLAFKIATLFSKPIESIFYNGNERPL